MLQRNIPFLDVNIRVDETNWKKKEGRLFLTKIIRQLSLDNNRFYIKQDIKTDTFKLGLT